MTDFTIHKPTLGGTDYPAKIDALIDAIDAEHTTTDFSRTSDLIELTTSGTKLITLRNASGGFRQRVASDASTWAIQQTDASGTGGLLNVIIANRDSYSQFYDNTSGTNTERFRTNATGMRFYSASFALAGSRLDGLYITGGDQTQYSYTGAMGFGAGTATKIQSGIRGYQWGGDPDVMGLSFFGHKSSTGTADCQELALMYNGYSTFKADDAENVISLDRENSSIVNGNHIGRIRFRTEVSGSAYVGTQIISKATETHSASASGSQLVIQTTANTTTTPVTALTLGQDLGATFAGQVLASNGSGAAPGYSFSSDTDSGIWLNGTSELHFALGTTTRAKVWSNGLDITGSLATTGSCLTIDNVDALTTGSAISVVSDSTSSSERELVFIDNTNTSATDAAIIGMNQDATAPFFRITGVTNANTTSAISTLTTSGSVTHHLQIEIGGVKAWIPCSTNNPS